MTSSPTSPRRPATAGPQPRRPLARPASAAASRDYAGLDANLVRLLVVLGTVLGFGSLLVAYVVAWVLMPQG